MYVSAGFDRKQNKLAKKRPVLKVQERREKKGTQKEEREKATTTNQNTKSIHTAIEHELNEHRRMCHAPKMQNPAVEKQITEWKKERQTNNRSVGEHIT